MINKVSPSIKAEAWAYCEFLTNKDKIEMTKIINSGNNINNSSIFSWDGVTTAFLVGSIPTHELHISCRGTAIVGLDKNLIESYKLYGWTIQPFQPSQQKSDKLIYMDKQIIFSKTISIN